MRDRGEPASLTDQPQHRASAIPPPDEFVEQANVTAPIRKQWEEDWPACWTKAADLLDWTSPYDSVLSNREPPLTWFPGGTLNASANTIDRHVASTRQNSMAIRWVGRKGETRALTYQDLHREVNNLAAGLRALGVGEGDVVTLYLPVIPELPIAMLASARIGAPHQLVFAGLSASSLADRLENGKSRYLVTADGYYRDGEAVDLQTTAVNASLAASHEIEETVVVDRLGTRSEPGQIYTPYEELVDQHAGANIAPVHRTSADPLFYIYTSGTTGEPKRIRHSTGGYLAQVAWTTQAALDLTPSDTFWSTADIGWITGHSYVVYGPLLHGATTLLVEGTPLHPEGERIWQIIEDYAVDVFYTSPPAISAFMQRGEEYPARHDLSSLRLLGSVGEPISQRAWRWYYEHVGDESAAIVDTWWQTETGGIMLSTLPGVDSMRPGAVGPPLPGVSVGVIDDSGQPVSAGDEGYLVIDKPWPGMALSLAENADWAARARQRYPAPEDGWTYFTGDRVRQDSAGYVKVLGRIDDDIRVAGRRYGSNEIEQDVLNLDGVAEAAVVSTEDDEGGSTIYVFVTPVDERTPALQERVQTIITETVGAPSHAGQVVFTPSLPKTRSGKITRRFLEDLARGTRPEDTSALRNPQVVGEIDSNLHDEPDSQGF